MPSRACARTAGMATALAGVQAALEPLRLEQVSCTSWLALRESVDGSQPDLDCGINDASSDALYALARSLNAVRASQGGDALWEWLALPADSEAADRAGVFGALSRAKALLVVLGQAVLGPADLWTPAGTAYFALLAVDGAEQSWGTLFHPLLFQRVMCALRPLRAEAKRRKVLEAAFQTADEEEEAAPSSEAQAAQASQDEQSVQLEPSRLEALDLLRSLLALLQVYPIGASEETALLTINELAALILHPSDEVVAQSAAEGLLAVVRSAPVATEARLLATTVLRAVLPAILMTQDKGVSMSAPVPRRLHQARAAALGLAQGLVRVQPELLKRKAEGAASSGTSPPAVPEQESEKHTDPVGNSDSDYQDERGPTNKSCEADAEVDRHKKDKQWLERKAAARRAAKAQGADDPILALLQVMCVSTPERVEWRVPGAEAVLGLLVDAAAVERAEAERAPRAGQMIQQLIQRSRGTGGAELAADATQQEEEQQLIVGRFLAFLERLLESERATCRIFAAEVAGMALLQSKSLVAADAPEGRPGLDRRLLVLLVRRCGDAVPSVRSRALNGIAVALHTLTEYAQGREMLSAPSRSGGRVTATRPLNLAKLFRTAALDEKALARRAALGLFEASLRAFQTLGLGAAEMVARLDAELLGRLAMDDSMLVRKATISSISLLLELCPLPQASKLWAHHVLPLVLDPEGSVVERALEEVYAAVLVPLAKLAPGSRPQPERRRQAAGGSGAEAEADLALALPTRYQLPAALHGMDSEVTEYLQRAVRCFANRNQGAMLAPITKALAAVVQESLALPIPTWPLVVWSLLEELVIWPCCMRSGQMPPSLVHDAWDRFDSDPQGAEGSHDARSSHRTSHLGVQILGVLEFVGPYLPEARAQRLADSLCLRVASLRHPAEHVRAAMRVIDRLDGAGLAGTINIASWRGSLLQSIETALGKRVRQGDHPESSTAEDLGSCLFTLGELALADEGAISSSTVRCLQTIVTEAASDRGTTATVRGHALAALGKLCLRREELAKRSVELFVIHLDSQQPFAVRNNALLILGDLCEHYTSLVETFVPSMSDLLRDPNELLRKQSAMILASLLSENFIKFRGSLVHRFLYALSDPADSIRHLVECVFTQILHRRNAAVFVQNFTDAVCALNGWDGHPSYAGAASDDGFSLQSSPARRTTVYHFMLALMTREQKFTVCSQLVTGFLAPFVEGSEDSAESPVGAGQQQHLIELPRSASEPAGQALGDALALLGCKEMRICFSPKLAGQVEDEVDSLGCASAAGTAAAAGTGGEVARGALSGMLRRVVCESIAPILVQLKDLMEAQRSPFLGRVRHCLCEILREFKEDLKDFLGADARLAEEVAFDLGGEAGEKTAQAAGTAQAGASEAQAGNATSDVRPLRLPKVGHRFRKRPSLRSAITGTGTPGKSDAPVEMTGLQKMLLRIPVRRRSIPGGMQLQGQSPTAPAQVSRTPSEEPHCKRRRASSAFQADAPPCSPAAPPCAPVGRPVATPQAPRRQLCAASSAKSPGLGLVGIAMSIQKGERTPLAGDDAQEAIPIGVPSTPRRSSGLGLVAAAAQCTPQGTPRSTLRGTPQSTPRRRLGLEGAATPEESPLADWGEPPSMRGGLLSALEELQGWSARQKA